MKMKLFLILLLVIGLTILSLPTAISKSSGRNIKNAPNTSAPPVQEEDDGPPYPLAEQIPEDPPGTINGADTPELISDEVAYSLFFDLIGNRETEEEISNRNAYLEQISLDEADTNALMSAIETFHSRSSTLAAQAYAIKIPAHPDHIPLSAEANEQLEDLDRQQTAVARETIDSLTGNLSTDGSSKLRQHIDEAIKPQTKIFPDGDPPR